MARQNQKSVIETFEKLKSGDYSRKGLDYEFVETDVRLKKIAEILNEARGATLPELEGKDDVSARIHNAMEEYNGICQHRSRTILESSGFTRRGTSRWREGSQNRHGAAGQQRKPD